MELWQWAIGIGIVVTILLCSLDMLVVRPKDGGGDDDR